MLYQTKRLLVEALELEEPLEAEDGQAGEILGVPGDWLVRKLGGEEWYLVPGPEFAQHYEPTDDDVDLAAIEEASKGLPEGGGQ